MGLSGGASAWASQYASAKPGGPSMNMRLSWSSGSLAPWPLSTVWKPFSRPGGNPTGSLLWSWLPPIQAWFPTTDRQTTSPWMRSPADRLKSSYCPCTVPSAYLRALNENVLSSPATVNCPAPVADWTTGPFNVVGAAVDLAAVAGGAEPAPQAASTTANSVVVQLEISRMTHLLQVESRISGHRVGLIGPLPS